MRTIRLALLAPLSVLVGCSSPDVAVRPGPSQSRTGQEQIERIRNDPNVPEGLKQIQTEAIQRQTGIRP